LEFGITAAKLDAGTALDFVNGGRIAAKMTKRRARDFMLAV
jgi:hypothetical protein